MNRKAQEEMVGFVLVVVVVAVVFLVFIGIAVSGARSRLKTESADISQFVDSVLLASSDCAVGYEPNYVSISRLIKECDEGTICTSGEDSCNVLEKNLGGILQSSWNVGEDRPVEWYQFRADYIPENGVPSLIIGKSSGENIRSGCSGNSNQKGVTRPIGDKITVTFFICEKTNI